MTLQLIHGDCLEAMATLPTASVDLTATSPPYDNLRTYNGSLNDWTESKWKAILAEIYRVTKPGGVVVWVVGDATIDGSESGTSFRQALHAMECGFRLHDTMIWNKGGFSAVGSLATRYGPVFEYMFIFSKGALATFHPIKDKPNKWAGTKNHGTVRVDGDIRVPVSNSKIIAEFGQRFNIWEIPPQRQQGDGRHPAPFPLALAADHILSWSNHGDVVFDPFLGSGTTGVAALKSGRRFIGIERDAGYFEIARDRIETVWVAPLVAGLRRAERIRALAA
jgi:DNA modification methylase